MAKVTLGDAAEYINGRAFKPTEWEEKGLPIIRIQNLNNPDAQYNYTTKRFEDKYLINNGDLLFAWSASLGAHIWQGGEAWLNQHIFKVVPSDNTNKHYLYYYLLHIIDELYAKTHGSGMVHITLKPFKATEMYLPSLLVQQRIVDVIESLFEKLDTAKELVQNALDSFENRKAAILHKAFTGELTAKWREERNFYIENSAISILETIKKFKQRKQKSDVKANLIAEDEVPFILPSEWIWSRLGDIQEVSSGIQKTPKRKPDKSPIPYLAVANVKRGYLDLMEVKEFEVSNEEMEKFILKYNDILIIEGNGSASEIGRCAIWKDEITPCVHQNHIIKSRNYVNLILPEFILYYLNSSVGMELMKSKAKTTAGLYNLSTGKVKEIVVPIPSLEEQREIVRILDNLLESEQRAKELSNVIEKIDLMKKAILARAFRGELGTNNPVEESTVELLKEVLKEKI